MPGIAHYAGACRSSTLCRKNIPASDLKTKLLIENVVVAHQPTDGVYFTNQFTPARERERWHSFDSCALRVDPPAGVSARRPAAARAAASACAAG